MSLIKGKEFVTYLPRVREALTILMSRIGSMLGRAVVDSFKLMVENFADVV